MIEYKSFDVTYWPDNDSTLFKRIFEFWDRNGQNSFIKTSLSCLKDLQETWKDVKGVRGRRRAETFQLIIDNVLKECPKIDEDEEFLLLMWW